MKKLTHMFEGQDNIHAKLLLERKILKPILLSIAAMFYFLEKLFRQSIKYFEGEIYPYK